VTAEVERPAHASLRRDLLLIGLGACGAFLAWILLWPSGYYASWIVVHSTQALYDVGLPRDLVTTGRVEFGLNAAMVAPVVLFGVLLWPRSGWERWTAYAFVVSSTVELVQALWLPMRSAQYVDVVANTVGAGVGAILGRLLVNLTRR
jgi:glycopeptide antibiotics resistance protein